MRPMDIKPAEINRHTPNPSLKMKVDISAANNTLVSLRAETVAIGAKANAQTIIQYAVTCIVPPNSPV